MIDVKLYNVVYKLSFTNRIKDLEPPYYYVGSKSNCRFVDGKILDKNNNHITALLKVKR